MGSKVILNIYDLAPGANNMLYVVGLGLHHSGVEIDGVEYSFAQGAGIFEQSPKVVPNAIFRESIDMGVLTDAPSSQVVRRALADLREDFHGDAYHLIRRNCNHFANAFCWVLLRKAIPAYVNRLAELGICCSCLLPKKLLEDSPVRAPGDTTNSGFQKFGPTRTVVYSSTQPVFSGSGLALGSSTSRNSTHRTAAEDLTDRRERARKAALARLDQAHQPDSQETNTVNTSGNLVEGNGGYKQS